MYNETEQYRDTTNDQRYPDQIIKQISRELTSNSLVSSLEELVGEFFKHFADNDKPSRYITLPYISGITDALRRILLKQNIRMTTQPLKTLQECFFPLNIKSYMKTNEFYLQYTFFRLLMVIFW